MPPTMPRATRASDRRLRIVVGGFIGLLPFGGVTWDYVQYLLGLVALGHDVFYVEDTRLWPVFQQGGDGGSAENVRHLAAVMDAFGLADRWTYRDEVSGRCFGMSEARLRGICRTADVFVNLSCSTCLRDEYRAIPTRVLVDTDPMFTQVQYVSQLAFTPGAPGMRALVDGHTHHFTFGENVGAPDCRMPDCGLTWLPTRQPISLRHWPARALPTHADAAFTTVMNWAAGRALSYAGESWGQKDVEFLRVLDLPRAVPATPLVLAVGLGEGTRTTGFPHASITAHGWQVLDAATVAPTWTSYREFVGASAGELSVAKETYVKARTGWFSCRSACYLAAGRPVIAQETGWSRHVPAGCGALAFDDCESAADALRRVSADPAIHARAARQLAEAYFDSDAVLGSLLDRVGG